MSTPQWRPAMDDKRHITPRAWLELGQRLLVNPELPQQMREMLLYGCALAVIECVQEMGQKPSGTATPATPAEETL